MSIKELFAWAKTEKVVPIDVFLQKLGIDVESSAIFAAARQLGSLDNMLAWAQPGSFKVIATHDLRNASIIKLRAGLRHNTDLIEALTDHVRVVTSQREYVQAKWG